MSFLDIFVFFQFFCGLHAHTVSVNIVRTRSWFRRRFLICSCAHEVFSPVHVWTGVDNGCHLSFETGPLAEPRSCPSVRPGSQGVLEPLPLPQNWGYGHTLYTQFPRVAQRLRLASKLCSSFLCPFKRWDYRHNPLCLILYFVCFYILMLI